jgi:hypothetical protein
VRAVRRVERRGRAGDDRTRGEVGVVAHRRAWPRT